jgi:hypothetical protein
VDRKSVGSLGSRTWQVSLSIPSNLKGPVHLPLRPVLPSLQTSTGAFIGVSWMGVTDGPFRWFKALLTCFWALILEISSIAFLIAAAHWVTVRVGGSRSVILG